MYLRESCCIRVKWLFLGKSESIRANLVVIQQKWLYSGKSGSNRAKVVLFGKKYFYSGKSGYLRESECIRANWF